MNQNRRMNVKRNAFWAITNRIIQTIFPFIIRTVLITIMGEQYTGLNGLFTSILKALSLAELGFSSAITYNMYKPIAENDVDLVCALLNYYRKIYKIVGCIILGAGVAILPFLKYLTNGECPPDINMYYLYLIFLGNTVLSYFLFAYRTSLLNAYQRYDLISVVAATTAIALYGMEILVIVFTRNYYLFASCAIVCTILNNLLILWTSMRVIPQIKCFGKVNTEVIDDVKKRVVALLGHRIGTAVITSADNIVISSILGLVAVTYYDNYYYVIAAMIGFIDVILGGATASIGNSIVTEDADRNHDLFLTMNFITFWIIGWGTICYIVLIQDFITLWLGKKFLYQSLALILLFGIYFYTWKIRSVVLRFKEAAGMWNADFWKPYVSALANIVINIILVQIIGISGVLISTILTMVLINLPWETKVLYRNLFRDNSIDFYKLLLKNVVVSILGGFSTYYICSLISMNVYIAFFIKLLICIVIPNIVFFIFYRNDIQFYKASRLIMKK